MSDEPSYSGIDRLLHPLAFKSPLLVDTLKDVEAGLFRNAWSDIDIHAPVFVTSLPRAGTTITLEILSRLPTVATHTYRDMPFILAPYLWSKLSKYLRKKSRPRERFHGDGLMVSEDSPEAFEEVIWKNAFPDFYRRDGIRLWDEVSDAAFIDEFRDQMKKLIALKTGKTGRYVSKNNANVARIALLRHAFPDALILTPVREPVEHAISLWRQHRKFLQAHREESFTKRYMRFIGHYEFGELHRPIQFPQFRHLTAGLSPDSVDYWLAYWISAYDYLFDYLLDHVPGSARPVFFLYERFCGGGANAIKTLADQAGLPCDEQTATDLAALLKPPPAHRAADHDIDAELTAKASTLYRRIEQIARL